MSPTSRKALLLLLLAALAFRLQFIAHDMRDLVTRGPLYDDSFYCFEVARNIAAGRGSTFDGVEATNGYQPLYVLLLVPVYALSGDNASAPIYAALLASAVLNVLTGWILYRIVRRYASAAAAVFGLVLWSFGPAIVRQSVNGLETALAMFLLAAALEYYLGVYRTHPAPGARQAATQGLLLGLAILARIDALLFAVALGVDALARRRAGETRRLLVAATFAFGLLLPWCLASLRLVGAVLPESGPATRFLSTAYATHDHPELGTEGFANGLPPRYFLANVVGSLLQLGTSPVVQVFTRAAERLAAPLRIDSVADLYAVAGVLALLLLALVFAARARPGGRAWLHRDFRFLFLYAALLLAAYSFVVFGQIFYSRYYYPLFFFSILLGAFAFDILVHLVRPGRARRVLVAGTIAGYGIALAFMCTHRIQNGNYRFLHVVDWIEAHTPADATIGVFNSGAIGYFSDRRVINLDGKVNPAALAALRAGRIREYVGDQGIDYVIDHAWIVGHFLGDAPEQPGLRLDPVDGDQALGVPGWVAFRVEREGQAGTRGSGRLASRRSP